MTPEDEGWELLTPGFNRLRVWVCEYCLALVTDVPKHRATHHAPTSPKEGQDA